MTTTNRALAAAGVAAACLIAQVPAWSAPTTSGLVLPFTCGDAPTNVLLSPGGQGNRSWSVDDSGVADGPTYHIRAISFGVYAGDLAAEPEGETPLFRWSKSYGKRVGQGETTTCVGRVTSLAPGGGTQTTFIIVDATSRA